MVGQHRRVEDGVQSWVEVTQLLGGPERAGRILQFRLAM